MRAIGVVLIAGIVGVLGLFAGEQLGRRAATGAASPDSLPTTDPADPDIRALIQLQERMAAALAPPDTVALDTLIAADWRGINGADQVLDKATARKILREAASSLVQVVDDSIQVRRYGQLAIMTLRETVTMRVENGSAVGRLRMTEVWLKRHGRWRAIASQAMVIGQPAA